VTPARRQCIAVLAAAAGTVLLAGCDRGSAPSFKATDITGADFGRQFELTGHDGKPRTFADFRGKLLVMFFGFVHCPDICPTTLSKLGSVMKLLGDDASQVQVLLVTVDPERDTPEVLAPYVTHFHPSFLGLTGSVEAIRATTQEFRIIAQKQPGSTPDAYTVDHSSNIYIYDREGRIRLFVNGTMKAEDIAADLKMLIAA
jgi:protein SCO1/2